MKNLMDYRQEIDELDNEIIELLNQRFTKTLEIKKYKQEHSLAIEDLKREEEIKQKIINTKSSEIVKEKLLGVYDRVIKGSKELQQ